MYNLYTDVLAI